MITTRPRAAEMDAYNWERHFAIGKLTRENMIHALHAIHAHMDGKEGSAADILDEIGETLRLFGLRILEPDEVPLCTFHNELDERCGEPASENISTPHTMQQGYWFCADHAPVIHRQCRGAARLTHEARERGEHV